MNEKHVIPNIVNGFGHRYSITKSGEVFNETRNRQLKPRPEKKGYLRVNLAGKDYKIHRLVAIMFIENKDPEKLKQVNHIDGDKSNNLVSNLEWTDNSGNMSHAYNTGLIENPIGEKNSNARITEEDVREIRKSSLMNAELSRIYGVSATQIGRIKNYKTWKHVK